jgi:flotillin
MQVEIIRREKETALAQQEALRKEQELNASIIKQADAEKYKQEKDAQAQHFREIQHAQAKAEAIRLEGTALADAKRMQGMAEVEIIRERGKAEAEAMLKKAEAFKQYNDAAVTQMIIEQLPQIAEQIAAPLSKTEKIVILDSGSGGNGGGAAKVTGYVTDIIATLPAAVEAITGIDLVDKIKGSGAGKKQKEGATEDGRPYNITTSFF